MLSTIDIRLTQVLLSQEPPGSEVYEFLRAAVVLGAQDAKKTNPFSDIRSLEKHRYKRNA